jgi:hypothetical protein
MRYVDSHQCGASATADQVLSELQMTGVSTEHATLARTLNSPPMTASKADWFSSKVIALETGSPSSHFTYQPDQHFEFQLLEKHL